MSLIASNLQAVNARIQAALRSAFAAAGRDVMLVAVSKTWPPEAIREAHAAGQRAIGENYVQEALAKIAALVDLDIEWHFIGPIQGNKARFIAQYFSWAHGVDRLKIAEALSRHRPAGRPPLNICIQVNVSGEASKGGVRPDEALNLARQVASLPHIRLRGLMTIIEHHRTLGATRAVPYAAGVGRTRNGCRYRARYAVDGHDAGFRDCDCRGIEHGAYRQRDIRQEGKQAGVDEVLSRNPVEVH